MKTTGWIFLVFGALSFLGAAFKGNSVFGPLFWISLGAYLLYRVNNKKTEYTETNITSTPATNTLADSGKTQQPNKPENNVTDKSPSPITELTEDPQLESLEEIQSQLTNQQREAAVCLIYFFGGFNDNLFEDTPYALLLKQAHIFFGVSTSPLILTKKYTDADDLINCILTIKSRKAKEFLLLTCYDLIRYTDKPESYDLLFSIANDMGYDRGNLVKLIESYK